MTIERAIEVFVKGVSFPRSYTHPCLAERIGPVWAVRDAPRKRPSYRKEEYVAFGVDPVEVHRIACEQTRGRYFICAITAAGDDPLSLKDAYKALGYRLMATEGFFVHDLTDIPKANCPYPVQRVLDSELNARLSKAAGSRQILPEHLVEQQSPIRQYVAISGRSPVGWVRSIPVGDATWVSNLYVEAAHRRQGVGGALMARMLLDDKAHGAVASVLLASHAGAMLYPTLGYERIGELMLFAPPKKR